MQNKRKRANGKNGLGGAAENRYEPASGWVNLLAILLRNSRLAVLIVAGFTLMGVILALVLPKKYEATAELLVEKVNESDKAMLFGVNMPAYYNQVDWLNSEIQILKSRPVAENVVQAFKLHLLDEPEPAGHELQPLLAKAVEDFREDLRVSKIGNSNVLRLRFEAKTPELAAGVVNGAIAAYKKQRSEIFRESAEYEFYAAQLEIQDKNLRELEEKMAAFKQSEALVEPKTQMELQAAKLSDYQSSLNDVQTNRIGREARLTILRAQLETGNDASIPATEISDSPSRADYITKIKSDLIAMQIQRDELLQKFSPEYSEVVELENRITSTREKLRSEIEDIIKQEATSIKVLRAQERRLESAMDSVRVYIAELNEKDYQLTQLSRGIEDARELYSVLLRKREDAKLSIANTERGVRIRVLSPAAPPLEHSRPRRKATAAISFLLGVFVALGTVLIKDALQQTRMVYSDPAIPFSKIAARLARAER